MRFSVKLAVASMAVIVLAGCASQRSSILPGSTYERSGLRRSPSTANQARYTFYNLRSFIPFRVSNSGIVAGAIVSGARAFAAEYRNGTIHRLSPDSQSSSFDVNDAGYVLGGNEDQLHPVLYHRGDAPIQLAPRGYDLTFTGRAGINDSNEIVGDIASPGSQCYQPARFNGSGGFKYAPSPINRYAAINQRGDIAGSILLNGGPQCDSSPSRAVLIEASGQVVKIPLPNDATSEQSITLDMNNRDSIVGEYNYSSQGEYAFLYSNGSTLEIPDAPNVPFHFVFASSVNDDDAVVGSNYAGAFLFSNRQLFNLNSFLHDSPCRGITLVQAQDINDRGTIVGWGNDQKGNLIGFMLMPESFGVSPTADAGIVTDIITPEISW